MRTQLCPAPWMVTKVRRPLRSDLEAHSPPCPLRSFASGVFPLVALRVGALPVSINRKARVTHVGFDLFGRAKVTGALPLESVDPASV